MTKECIAVAGVMGNVSEGVNVLVQTLSADQALATRGGLIAAVGLAGVFAGHESDGLAQDCSAQTVELSRCCSAPSPCQWGEFVHAYLLVR